MTRPISKRGLLRRSFLKGATAAAVVPTFLDARLFGQDAPSGKLNLACIGVAGRGAANLKGLKSENVVAVSEVDLAHGADMIAAHPDAKVFRDFRVMLDEMDDAIDAVVVSTPDHTHYTAAMAAIGRGKHVYCEKPLAHSVAEVRRLTEAARKAGVQTQMGNQGHSSDDIRRVCEWVADGRIGNVREVHAWSNRPAGGFPFPASLMPPTQSPPVPETLDWDLWLGPVAARPYHPIYAPFFWRGWIDFGTGALGDMGCHILDPAFWALNLGSPISVETNTAYNPEPALWMHLLGAVGAHREPLTQQIEAMRHETYPTASIIRYEFPARGPLPPVELTWYDGGLLPPRPKDLPDEVQYTGNGAFLIGDEGTIMHGSHGAGGAKLLPDTRLGERNGPPPTIPRVKGHHDDWIQACKGGTPASGNFDYGGPLTEMALLGVIAMQIPDTRLLWDGEKMQFTNHEQATALVTPEFQNGWKL